MLKACKKCGSGLKPKGFVYRSDKSIRYHRMRCVSCNAVNYIPGEERETKTFDFVNDLFKTGKLKIWFANKVWDVK